MKSIFLCATILASAVLFERSFAVVTTSAPARGDQPTERSPAQIFRPTYAPAKKYPVVLLLHGYGGNASFMRYYTGLASSVEARGFILVIPEGMKNTKGYRYWNATAGCCDFDHRKFDDTAYLLGLIEDLKKSDPVDENRIVAFGHSNGGFMAYHLACEPGNPFAAITSFAGSMVKDASSCRSTRAVSILEIHALDDDTIFYEGDNGYPGLAAYPGARESTQDWATKNHCDRAAKLGPVRNLINSVPGDDTSTERWENCAGGSEVELWTIQRSPSWWKYAHTPWLGGEFTERILDFLLAQKKTPALEGRGRSLKLTRKILN